MKLWCTRIYYSDGVALDWQPTKRAALAMRKILREAYCYADGTPADVNAPEAVNVPTIKRELVGWLNSNLSSDNG